MNNGIIRAYVGARNSGKTKKCIDVFNFYADEYSSHRAEVAIYTPSYKNGGKAGFVRDRTGRTAPAVSADSLIEIAEDAARMKLKIVLIDEIQNFRNKDAPYILEGMALAGMEVYLFGLDVDSDNVTCGNMGDPLAHADEVFKLKVKCACGEYARIPCEDDELMGESEYSCVPSCRKCYYENRVRLKMPYDLIEHDLPLTFNYYIGPSVPIQFTTTQRFLESKGYTVDYIRELTDPDEVLALLQHLGGDF